MEAAATIVAVDIGSMWVKAMATVPGGTRRAMFPTRLMMGERAPSGHEDEPISVVVRGATVRVGDRTSRAGLSEIELPRALSKEEAVAALLGGAFQRLDVRTAKHLMLSISVASLAIHDNKLVGTLAAAAAPDRWHPTAANIGCMPPAAALLADATLNLDGSHIRQNKGPALEHYAVIDCGAAAWRLAVIAGASPTSIADIALVEVPVDFATERKACEIIESRLRDPVHGVAEMMQQGESFAQRGMRDVSLHIEEARREAWRAFGDQLLKSSVEKGVRTLYVGGGNASVIKAGFASRNDIDCRIAKQCEISIVRGLLKSGRRWGKSRG